MTNFAKQGGRNRSFPQLESARSSLTTAGNGNDGNQLVLAVVTDPKLKFNPTNLGVGVQDRHPPAQMTLTEAMFISENGTTNVLPAGTTDTFDWRVNVWRKGVNQGCIAFYPMSFVTTISSPVSNGASTTSTTAVSPGSVAVTPASVVGIVVGIVLLIDAGNANQEYVVVTSGGVGGTTFTATFANSHSGTYSIRTVVPPGAVNTTATTAVTSGATVITPADMTNIVPGILLNVYSGTGTAETVPVTATTSTTFTATFANSHSGTYSISLSSSLNGVSRILLAASTNLWNGLQAAIDTSTNLEVVTLFNVDTTNNLASGYFATTHVSGVAANSISIPYRAVTFIQPKGISSTATQSVLAPGSVTIAQFPPYGIHVGDYLLISGGSSIESIAATVSSTTLTATFAAPHAGTYNVGYAFNTTSSTAVTGGATTTIAVADATNITTGASVVLQGTAADAAKTDTVTVLSVASLNVTFSAAPTNSYSNPIQVTNAVYSTSTTAIVANVPTDITLGATSSLYAVGDIVYLKSTAGSTAAEYATVTKVTSTTHITVLTTAAHSTSTRVLALTKTTSTTAITPTGAAQAITLTSATGFGTSQTVYVWGGTGNTSETVLVTAVGDNSWTATFAAGHTGTWTLTSTANQIGSVGDVVVPTPNSTYFDLIEGDVVTFQRLSSTVTGLASPPGVLAIDWDLLPVR
jgi:hypothetical protein